MSKHSNEPYQIDHEVLEAVVALISLWESLAEQSRDRGDMRQPGDPPSDYYYGMGYGLETAASELRELLANFYNEEIVQARPRKSQDDPEAPTKG